MQQKFFAQSPRQGLQVLSRLAHMNALFHGPVPLLRDQLIYLDYSTILQSWGPSVEHATHLRLHPSLDHVVPQIRMASLFPDPSPNDPRFGLVPVFDDQNSEGSQDHSFQTPYQSYNWIACKKTPTDNCQPKKNCSKLMENCQRPRRRV